MEHHLRGNLGIVPFPRTIIRKLEGAQRGDVDDPRQGFDAFGFQGNRPRPTENDRVLANPQDRSKRIGDGRILAQTNAGNLDGGAVRKQDLDIAGGRRLDLQQVSQQRLDAGRRNPILAVTAGRLRSLSPDDCDQAFLHGGSRLARCIGQWTSVNKILKVACRGMALGVPYGFEVQHGAEDGALISTDRGAHRGCWGPGGRAGTRSVFRG